MLEEYIAAYLAARGVSDAKGTPSSSRADPRTTKLYDRHRQKVTRGEVERIRYERKQEGMP